MQDKYIADIDSTQNDTFARLENLYQKEVKRENSSHMTLTWACSLDLCASSLAYSLASLDWKT